MKVIITETASAASAIARALNVQNNDTSFAGVTYDNDFAVITIPSDFICPYGIGVLPGKDALPIVPERYTYGIRQTPDENGRYGISSEDQAYADYVGNLIRGGKEVIFASDGGADAQGSFANICRFFKVGVPTSRMQVKVLERKAIRKAYRMRQWGRKLHDLAQSGLVGMAMDEAFKYNVTEAYRSLFKDMEKPIQRQDLLVLSVAKSFLGVEETKRDNHVPVITHSIMVSGEVFGKTVKMYHCSTFDSREEAEAASRDIVLPATVKASDVCIDVEKNQAPALFTLVTLQCEAWERLHINFSTTRDIAISLYERGYISTPLTFFANLPESAKQYLNRYKWVRNYPFVEDGKINGNHGIILTENKPISLESDEQRVYDLIRARFYANLSGPTTTRELVIGVEINGEPFYGTIPYSEGMGHPKTAEVRLTGKSVFTNKSAAPAGPKMSDLFTAVWLVFRSLSMQFNPDMPFTLAHHDVSDAFDRLRANRFLLDVCGEPVVTSNGRLLLETFDESFALDILLAYQVEVERIFCNRRKSIGGKRLLEEFGQRIYNKTEQLITDSRLFPATEDTHVCPICGRHSVLRYPRVAKCHICGFTMPLQFKGHKFTDKEIDSLLTHGYTSQIMFTNRRGHEFYDIVVRGKGKGLEFAPIAAKLY
ncbi:MAG: DNA topoisomerase [Muribaculaceae bacterium]|nr:DNA topoisomerase [Muribaculaceae bacterium]